MPTTAEKIESLQALNCPAVFELMKVEWGSPTGTIYYAVTQVDEIQGSIITAIDDLYSEENATIETRILPDNVKNNALFLGVTIAHGIGDDEVPVKLSDIDNAISDLFELHGEGHKVTLLYYFPDVDLLLPHFWGHLQQEDETDEEVCKVKVASGFRSAQLSTPRRRHNFECQAIFGGLLTSLTEIAHNDCPYNAHLPGGTIGNLDEEDEPYLTCPRRIPADCIARLGPFPSPDLPTTGKRLNHLQMLSHTNIQGSVINNQSQGPNLTVTSRGNQSNLKESVRVILGTRYARNLQLLQYAAQTNTANPGDGFVRVMFEVCEGPVQQIAAPRVNGTLITSEHLNIRGGEVGQPATFFANPTHNYSGTAHYFAVWGRVNPANYGPQNLSGECVIFGKRDERVYSDDSTYIETFQRLRSWHLLEVLCNKRWGYGLDYERMDIDAFIDLAEWDNETVTFTDPDAGAWTFQRGFCDLDLAERSTQQQIMDICLGGRYSMPYLVEGKIRVVPLSALTEGELDACPVFSDEGTTNRNIVRDEKTNKSSLTRKKTNPRDLVNEITVTFDDARNADIETSVTVRDDLQQLKAGRSFGDTTRRVVEKKQSLMGVRVKEQAVKLAFGLLNLGAFDGGGLVNNLEIKFVTWFSYTLDLHPAKVIKVESSSLSSYLEPGTENAFEYFRIKKIKRLPNLLVEITAQAYPVSYMDSFETTITPGTSNGLYEAEDATLTGDCVVVTDGDLSGGEGAQLENGTIEYADLDVQTSGGYTITIYYKSDSAHIIPVQVRNNVYGVAFEDTNDEVFSVDVVAGLSSTTTNRCVLTADAGVTDLVIDRLALDLLPLEDDTNGCVLGFGTITYEAGVLSIPILNC